MLKNQLAEDSEIIESKETAVVSKSRALEELIASLTPKPVPVVEPATPITRRGDPYGFD